MNSGDAQTIYTDRLEFIETLSHEFLTAKGYGVYAHLSTVDVMRLFEQFQTQGIPPRHFAKAFVKSF